MEAIDRQVELDIETARRLQGELKENKEDAEGNENIAGQGEDIGRTDNVETNGDDRSTAL